MKDGYQDRVCNGNNGPFLSTMSADTHILRVEIRSLVLYGGMGTGYKGRAKKLIALASLTGFSLLGAGIVSGT